MKYALYTIFLTCCLVIPFTAIAQDAETIQDNTGGSCAVAEKAIIRLDKPSFAGRVVWRRLYGSAKDDQALAVFTLQDTVIGLSRESEGDRNLTLTVFDRNGRLVRQSDFPVKNIANILRSKYVSLRIAKCI